MVRCQNCGRRDASVCSRCGVAACDWHLSNVPGTDGLYCTKCVTEIIGN